MKKAFKKTLFMSCIVALLFTTHRVTLIADDLQEELIGNDNLDESSVVSVREESELEVIQEDLTTESEGLEEDLGYWEDVSVCEPPLYEYYIWTVGDGVTAELVKEEDKNVLYLDSKGGTLWSHWRSEIGSTVEIVDIIKFTPESTVMYLPSDSSYLFCGRYGRANSLLNIQQIQLDKIDTSNVKSMRGMFDDCYYIKSLDLSNFNTTYVTDMSDMFNNCFGLTSLDLSEFNTSYVTDMSNMFYGCSRMTSLDIRKFDTSNVTNMSGMFYKCRNLTTLDLNGFNTSSVTNMTNLFYECRSLKTLNLSQFNTENVTNMSGFFRDCRNLITLDLSTFDTSRVTNMAYMFSGCSGLKELDLSSFDMSATNNTWNMFSEDLRKLKTPKQYSTNNTTHLPHQMCDDSGQSYSSLSGLTESVVLYFDISACSISLSQGRYVYDGNEKEPAVSVWIDVYKEIMVCEEGYEVSYQDNINAGTALVTVNGTGLYRGEITATFTISKADTYLIFPEERIEKTIFDGPFTNELINPSDEDVIFSSSDPNVATVSTSSGQVTIKGTGTTTITVKLADNTNYTSDIAWYILDVSGISIENASVGGVSLSYGYSGKAYTPPITVKVDGKTLTKETDYVVWYENNIKPGTATITVSGKGIYSGTKIKTFEIVDCASSIVSGKTYQLVPKNNSDTAVCAIGGKMVNNTKVYITDRGNSESQKFKAVQNTDDTWKFINAKCELTLAVQQNSSALGAGLVLYDQTTRPAQNWKLSKKADNSFAIINSVTGYSIAMSDKSAVKGTTLSMAKTASVGLQRFYLVETSAVSVTYNGPKSIRAAKNKNFALNIASSSKEDGANVNLYTYSNTNARKFRILYSGGGYYRLVNVNSGLCLTIKGNSNADGANIIQSKWKGYSSQRWKITYNYDGTVTFTSMLGTVLHLNGNITVNNRNVHARKEWPTTAQKWYFN